MITIWIQFNYDCIILATVAKNCKKKSYIR